MNVLKNINQILRLFPRKSIYIFLVLFLVNSILETFGLSLVIPIIAILIDPNFLNKIKVFEYSFLIPNFIYDLSSNEILVLFSALLISVYILKNVLILLVTYYINKFTGLIQANLVKEVFLKYLHQSYLFHVKKKQSEINSNINQRIIDVSHGCIASLLFLLTEVFVILSVIIIIFLLGFQKILAIFCIMILVSLLIIKLLKTRIKIIAKKKLEKVSNKYSYFQNIINNLRTIILYGKFNFFFKDFYHSLFKETKYTAKHNTYQRVPSAIFEIFGLLSLISIIFFMKYFGYSNVKILTICSFFAVISYRLIPSLNRILFFYYQIIFHSPSLKIIINELNLINKIIYHDDKLNNFNKIILSNVSFKYPESDYILKDINLEFNKNEIIGICGESGSGKTTFLDLITFLINPSQGKILVNDHSVDDKYKIREVQNSISYCSQKTSIVNGKFKDNICFGENTENFNKTNYYNALKLSQLQDFENKDNMEIGDNGSNLSGGQLQRIGIARALYRDSEVLIFDEATSALDERNENQIIWNLSNNIKNKLIIIITHRLKNLDICNQIFKIKDKKFEKIK